MTEIRTSPSVIVLLTCPCQLLPRSENYGEKCQRDIWQYSSYVLLVTGTAVYTIVEVAVQANQVMGTVVLCLTTKKLPQQI